MSELPDRAAYRRRWSALHGGFDPSTSRATDGWLTLMEAAARPLARRRVTPNALTVAGVFVAAAALPPAAAGGRWPLLAGAAVIGSVLADGLDGSVAVMTDQATPWGHLLDSLLTASLTSFTSRHFGSPVLRGRSFRRRPLPPSRWSTAGPAPQLPACPKSGS